MKCRHCGATITRKPDAPRKSSYAYVDRHGLDSCETRYDDCPACQDGEAHPHER